MQTEAVAIGGHVGVSFPTERSYGWVNRSGPAGSAMTALSVRPTANGELR